MSDLASVKSARRVFRILENFSECRREQRAAEIARLLEMPISSTIALLSTMVEEKILFFDATRRTYIPTDRLRRLSDWIVSDNALQRRVISFARRLHRETGAPTAVTRRAGLYLEWIYTLNVADLQPGAIRPLCRTVNGVAVMSRMTDSQVEAIVGEHNECFGRRLTVELAPFLERIHAAQHRGYVSGAASIAPGRAAVSFLVADEEEGEELVLTVDLPASELRLRERKVVDIFRRIMLPVAVGQRSGSIGSTYMQ